MNTKSFRISLPPELLNPFDDWRGKVSRNDAIAGLINHVLNTDLKIKKIKAPRPIPEIVEPNR